MNSLFLQYGIPLILFIFIVIPLLWGAWKLYRYIKRMEAADKYSESIHNRPRYDGEDD